MAAQTEYFNGQESFAGFGDGSQTSVIRYNCKVDSYSFSAPNKTGYKFIAVSLNGTTVEASSTGKLAINQSDIRGWFTEVAMVAISLSPAGFSVEQDAPQTTMGSEVTTSSTSISFNESLGTFGPTPTVNVGAGITMGSSFSRNLADFKVVNISDNSAVHHNYILASSKGAPYDKPDDLLDFSASGQLSGTPLFELPDIAVANLPIISQAVFVADGGVGNTFNLAVTINHQLRKVEKTFEVLATETQAWLTEWSHTWNQEIHVPPVS